MLSVASRIFGVLLSPPFLVTRKLKKGLKYTAKRWFDSNHFRYVSPCLSCRADTPSAHTPQKKKGQAKTYSALGLELCCQRRSRWQLPRKWDPARSARASTKRRRNGGIRSSLAAEFSLGWKVLFRLCPVRTKRPTLQLAGRQAWPQAQARDAACNREGRHATQCQCKRRLGKQSRDNQFPPILNFDTIRSP